MAFPGTYDINYYKGDTFEFQVYPKDSNGNQFDLTDFDDAYFTIASTRGAATGRLTGLAQKRSGAYILCVITPTIGNQLVAGTKYYYDVEIKAPTNEDYSYPRVYTILTGSITVSEQVTLAADEV